MIDEYLIQNLYSSAHCFTNHEHFPISLTFVEAEVFHGLEQCSGMGSLPHFSSVYPAPVNGSLEPHAMAMWRHRNLLGVVQSSVISAKVLRSPECSE